jgi:Phage capsid scaffolding protein (GPO) serine peptidase
MSKLKTVWVPLATSGPVVDGANDGRFMKREWLEDMADVYNTKVFTAKLWPEHRRYYSGGTVLALKVEPATEAELEGEVQLFGILSPSDWIVRANREGDYTFPSIEVGEDYRGTGKFYLKGLGLTDQPASSGVTELNFSTKDGTERAHIVSGPQFNLAEAIDNGNDSLLKRVFSKLGSSSNTPTTAEDDTMTPEQLEALQATLTQHIDTLFSTLTGELKPGSAPQGEGEPAAPAEPVTAEKFSALETESTDLKGRLDALETKFSSMSNEPNGQQTPAGEGEGNGEANQVI